MRSFPGPGGPSRLPAGASLSAAYTIGDVHDFLAFRRMITPWVIEYLFVLGALLCLIGGGAVFGIGVADQDARRIWLGLGLFVLGPIVLRLYAEFLVVVFRINETLTDLRNLGDWAANRAWNAEEAEAAEED